MYVERRFMIENTTMTTKSILTQSACFHLKIVKTNVKDYLFCAYCGKFDTIEEFEKNE